VYFIYMSTGSADLCQKLSISWTVAKKCFPSY
jgi:hypothetical protein